MSPELERQTGGYREAQFTGTEIHEQKPLWESVLWLENLKCNCKLLEAQYRQA